MASILVCDDDPLTVELLSSTLESQGYLVPVAQRGADAVDLALLHRPDLLLLDMELPDMSGLDVLRNLRAAPALGVTPAIFLTGVDDEVFRTRARELGAVAYIIKRAMRTQDLLATIAEHLPEELIAAADSDPFEDALRAADDASTDRRRILDPSPRTIIRIGRWHLLAKIGRGGMGDVYAAEADGVRAAVKVLPLLPDLPAEARWRFEREIEALRRLRHPHIVEFLDSGIDDEQQRPYLAMRLVQAPDLRRYVQLRGGSLAQGEIVHLGLQLAAALSCANEAGIIHRDVKPTNVLLDVPRRGEREPFCALLCDFGLARFRRDPHGGGEISHFGYALGTPGYMSPEQAAGLGGHDIRQDVFGLGATLFYGITGHAPVGGGPDTRMHRARAGDFDLSLLAGAASSVALLDLVRRMIAHDPTQRPGSWDEVRTALTACA